MPYADKTYYRNTYKGRAISVDADLDAALARAADEIDIYADFSIVESDLTALQLELLKKANCAQAEGLYFVGDGIDDDFTSVSLGAFSMSGGKNATRAAGDLFPNALKYLYPAGLGYRGIKCGPYRAQY